MYIYIYGGFPNLVVPFEGPYNRDYNILGLIWGSPDFGKLPCLAAGCLAAVPINL